MMFSSMSDFQNTNHLPITFNMSSSTSVHKCCHRCAYIIIDFLKAISLCFQTDVVRVKSCIQKCFHVDIQLNTNRVGLTPRDEM